jgi:hypothetical protein
MDIDLSTLTAQELDQLIAAASTRREEMSPVVPFEQPQGEVRASLDPKWYVTNTANGTFFQIRHNGKGWVNFILPVLNRSYLLAALLQNATGPQPSASSGAPLPISGGGGSTLH